MPTHLHLALLASLLGGASAAGLYTKSSPVIQVEAKNYDSLIAKSNHTSVCEK
jgi:protein disulfide-isomerase A6